MTNRDLWLRFVVSRAEARARHPKKEVSPMDNRIRWLRIAYWTGAIIDALAFIPLVNSDVWAALNQVPNFHADWDFRYSQAFAAAFMAGWTILLIWADRNPLERRGILLITVFPVIVGLNSARYILYMGGMVPVPFTTLGVVIPVILSLLFLFAYVHSFAKGHAAVS